jgi:hypothetical protein
MRIIQFLDNQNRPQVGTVCSNIVRSLDKVQSVYELFMHSEKLGMAFSDAVSSLETDCTFDYEELIARGAVLLPVGHPDPYHTWVTGTGLTHLGSATSRDQMHKGKNVNTDQLTDSIKIFQAGVKNGKLFANKPGVQPEWFFKGNGLCVCPPGGDIVSPGFALNGGEEPEVAGIYIIDEAGVPKRLGFVIGNEFSDHEMEKLNYLYLAHSKLRPCSYGPELLIGDLPLKIKGTSTIIRNGEKLWEKEFFTGEGYMSHNIANLEYHNFKYDLFRQPGDLHVHFFGTSVLSFTDNIIAEDGDLFVIEADGMGKPLINKLSIQAPSI